MNIPQTNQKRKKQIPQVSQNFGERKFSIYICLILWYDLLLSHFAAIVMRICAIGVIK
jgi:hypothetical protein